MNIEKAIEILSHFHETALTEDMTDFIEAIQLGSEALKRHAKRHQTTFTGMLEPLQGETDV